MASIGWSVPGSLSCLPLIVKKCAMGQDRNALLQSTTAQWNDLYIRCLGDDEFVSNWQTKISNRLILTVGKVNGSLEWIEM